MRKFLSGFGLFILSALEVFAITPSAELDNFDDGDNYTKQGLYRILRREPIKYAYEVITPKDETDPSGTNNLQGRIQQQAESANYKKIIEENLKEWPLQVAEFIKNSGRAEKFADILPLFSKAATENVNSAEEADVFFIFSKIAQIRSVIGGAAACGLTSDFGQPVKIWILDPNLDISSERDSCYGSDKTAYDVSKKVALHEIGHYYALAEQYDTSNASVLFSDSDRINRKSIMGASYDKKLSCDDVDGFIKIADRTFYKMHGKYTTRDSEGWESFCNDGTVYKKGKVLNRKPFYSKWKIYKYDEKGDIAAVIPKMPYMISETDTVIRNPQTGLITKVIDVPNNVYTDYSYHFSDETSSVEVSLRSLKDNEEKLSTRYDKLNKYNFWVLGRTHLSITPEQCHFIYSENASASVDRATNALSLVFAWGGKDANYVRVKKYDFSGKDYKCEYTLSEDGDAGIDNVLRRYVLQYRDKTKNLILEGSPAKKDKLTFEHAQEVCSDKVNLFPEMDRSYFVPACTFFGAVEEKISDL